jgi:5,6,7,8-tetrahydromethanopterin hydro-lyase
MDQVDDMCIVVGVFIHWAAKDDKKIYDYNYKATYESIERAMAGQPKASDVVAQTPAARHPFASGAEG